MVNVPCLLALRQVLVVFLHAKGQCSPYELGKKVEGTNAVGENAWKLVLDSYAVATQVDTGGGKYVRYWGGSTLRSWMGA